MAIKLNQAGFQHAERLIKNGLEIELSSNWEAVKPDQDEIVRFLNAHDLGEYGSWFLGIDSDAGAEDRKKYVLPWGDFNELHKSAVVLAQQEATKNNYADIKQAVDKLLAMLNAPKKK
jgi:hypothetical protein